MATTSGSHVTFVLAQSRQGDAHAASELLQLVYDELRSLAARYLQNERPDHTLQPTALVHEAYLRLVDGTHVNWRDRTHFFRTAAQTMRRILIEHARSRNAAKRGGDCQRILLDIEVAPSPAREIDLLELDDLLNKLSAMNERHCQVVELRFFAGLTIHEAAETLQVSTTTVENDWAIARAWLRSRLMKGESRDARAV
jgi:RNA polymerase sigma factor (TIGR02999 family)